MNLMQDKSTVIVIFAGLMVFHYHKQLHFFQVGILKGAQDHVLEIYQADGKKALTTTKTTMKREGSALWPDEMVLEVINNETGIKSTEAEPYEANPQFDRTDANYDRTDYRYVISFDELYKTEGHYIKDGSLGPNIYLRAGKLYTLCRTDFLKKKKGLLGQKGDFGFAAEFLGLTVELEEKQSLVLSGTNLKVDYKPGEQYVVISNIPPPSHRCGGEHNVPHCKDFDTHFQYYYEAIPKTFDRYDFGH